MTTTTTTRRRAGALARAARRPRPGQSLVLIALAFLVLLGGLGLAVDGGYTLGQRRAMQNAADAAALAGARVVATSTGSGSYPVLATVRDVAQRNGVQDPAANLDCWYITDSLAPNGACADGAIPPGSTGVQVTARETHATFVMVALGMPTSGTAATAAARVELVVGVVPGPFTVCGINTALASGSAAFVGPDGSTGIFQRLGAYTSPRDGGYSGCGSANGTCDRTLETTDLGTTIMPITADSEPVLNNDPASDSLYYYDWAATNSPAALAAPLDHDPAAAGVQAGPTFQIHGPANNPVAACNITSNAFKGVNTTVYPEAIVLPGGRDTSPPVVYGAGCPGTVCYGTPINLTPGNVASIAATVQRIEACVPGAAIDNCVLILPVIDNSGPGGSSPGNQSGPVQVGVRALMPFYVQQTAANQHTGRLVKNYPAVANGLRPGFAPGTGQQTLVRLVK